MIRFAAYENAPREVAGWSGSFRFIVLTTPVFEVECPLILEHRLFQPI